MEKILTPEKFIVLRQKGTEHTFSGNFNQHKEKGVYTCGGCGEVLFKSEQNYDSRCVGYHSLIPS